MAGPGEQSASEHGGGRGKQRTILEQFSSQASGAKCLKAMPSRGSPRQGIAVM